MLHARMRRVHISGLLVRSGLLLGPDGICASSPNQVNGLQLRPCPPSGSEEAGLSHLRHLRRLKHLDEIDPKTRRRGRWKSGKRKGFSKLAKQASFPRPENSASPHSQAVVCTLSRHTVVLPHALSATTQCGRSCLRPLRKPSSFLVFVVCQQSRRCEHLSCGMLGTLPIALRE